MSLDNARNSAYVYQRLHFDVAASEPATLGVVAPDIHNLSRLALCEVCEAPLTESQIKRGARHCGGGCRAKAFEARNPRLYAASIEQLEGELLKRLGKAAGTAEDRPVTVRALTRNVRVLKLTWAKLRSMTPSGKTFMQTLEKLVHEAWLSKEGS